MMKHTKDTAITICNAIRQSLPAKMYKCECGYKTSNVAQYKQHAVDPKLHDVKLCFDKGSRKPVLLEVVARGK